MQTACDIGERMPQVKFNNATFTWLWIEFYFLPIPTPPEDTKVQEVRSPTMAVLTQLQTLLCAKAWHIKGGLKERAAQRTPERRRQ